MLTEEAKNRGIHPSCEKMKLKELQQRAKAKGVVVPENATKKEIQELLQKSK